MEWNDNDDDDDDAMKKKKKWRKKHWRNHRIGFENDFVSDASQLAAADGDIDDDPEVSEKDELWMKWKRICAPKSDK